jgi:hypothetical protein
VCAGLAISKDGALCAALRQLGHYATTCKTGVDDQSPSSGAFSDGDDDDDDDDDEVQNRNGEVGKRTGVRRTEGHWQQIAAAERDYDGAPVDYAAEMRDWHLVADAAHAVGLLHGRLLHISSATTTATHKTPGDSGIGRTRLRLVAALSQTVVDHRSYTAASAAVLSGQQTVLPGAVGGGTAQQGASLRLGMPVPLGQDVYYFDFKDSTEGLRLLAAVRRAYREEWGRRTQAAQRRREAARRPHDIRAARTYPPYTRTLERLLDQPLSQLPVTPTSR